MSEKIKTEGVKKQQNGFHKNKGVSAHDNHKDRQPKNEQITESVSGNPRETDTQQV